jgi:ATP-binding cassette subfamily F protein 3
VSKTANKIWEIVDHEIKEFKGGYEEWVAWKERMAKQELENKKTEGRNQKSDSKSQKTENTGHKSDKQKASVESKKSTDPVPVAASINKEAKKELQKIQRQFQQVEEKLAQLNGRKKEMEASLVDPAIYSDKAKFAEAEQVYKKAETELKQLNAEYERLFELIMEQEK